jgi:hypothetical protein
MQQINEYETKCLKNTTNLIEFKKLIQNSEGKFKTWSKYLDQTYLVDS